MNSQNKIAVNIDINQTNFVNMLMPWRKVKNADTENDITAEERINHLYG
jgi:hypothetical protein